MAINKKSIKQIGILVHDIHEATEKWAKFLGVPAPEVQKTPDYEISHAAYRGKRCNGLIWQSIFEFENIQLELIQPVDNEKSIWRECLDRDGEGLHHLAFRVDGMSAAVKEAEDSGYPQLQKGDWVGGRYSYQDALGDMKIIFEFLEFDK
jgi:catechol 2,3-dioxygenase-like lactoylglutathione lyase family enzyme